MSFKATSTPLTLQSALSLHTLRAQLQQSQKRAALDEWRSDSPVQRRQRRISGLKRHASHAEEVRALALTQEPLFRTTHPKKLQATERKKQRISGLQHHHNKKEHLSVASNDVLYRTVHPKKLDVAKIVLGGASLKNNRSTNSTSIGRQRISNHARSLFRSTSEGASVWQQHHGGIRRFHRPPPSAGCPRRMLTTISA